MTPAAANLRRQRLATTWRRPRTGRCRARSGRRVGVLDDDLAAVPRQRGAGRPGRGEEPDLVDRELPLGEQPTHHPADLTRCSNDTYSHGRKANAGQPGPAEGSGDAGDQPPVVGVDAFERARRPTPVPSTCWRGLVQIVTSVERRRQRSPITCVGVQPVSLPGEPGEAALSRQPAARGAACGTCRAPTHRPARSDGVGTRGTAEVEHHACRRAARPAPPRRRGASASSRLQCWSVM